MRKFWITAGVLFVILITISLWWTNGLTSVNPRDNKPQIFIVERGQGIREIAKNLKDQGLIRDQIVFFLLTKQLGLDKKIEAGDYRFFKSMTATDLANGLTHGTLDIWITIPEGNRALEIAEVLAKRIPTYQENWAKALENEEGYLFPDTYLIPKDADINLIISIFKNNFEKKYATLGNPKNNLTKDEVVTVASLVEREARFDRDRPLVASVILNRLNLGMKLDIDATLQYALGYQESEKRWWKKSLKEADKAFDSAYNTYLTAGLPPAPISNPGLSSLEAAVNPATTNYLYYISDPKGNNHYAVSYQDHLDNVKKYGL